MKNIIVALTMTVAVAGCTATERGAATGAGVGAAVGAIATGDIEGAAVGGLVGAAAGAIIGSASERRGYCRYHDGRGGTYIDRCPPGYSW